MAEQHGHELAPTTEPAGVAFGPVLYNRPLELSAENNSVRKTTATFG